MRFITTLNNQKCMEWGLNATQGILVSLLYEANSWAKEIILEDKVYYFVSRNLVLQELPMFFEKADTVYRTLKALAEKGIIEYIKHKNMDLIRLTEKGKTWNFIKNNSEKNPTLEENSEKFPSELGKKSENNSEKNPTYKDTNKHKDINNNIKEKINKKEILIEHIQELDMEQERKEVFIEWIEYKQEIKNQYSSKKSIDILIKQWKNYDISTLKAALEKSIANGYKGLFIPKEPTRLKSYNPDSIDNMEVFR
ncbi:hypothetical protein A2U07_11205 [Fusobacterium necrophorum subsp. funduliforme]|uniref:hypothetical protein n=2 Tax=Fusobacterium necrophorum TaxID=859 RepID=UPI000787222A|nr:hypothetical protein [Fusobacterium necrophorum]KYM55956.1 hypothetical protein A2U07_11205 [Fusobacterium necrophorum subsp. funduliforme]